MFVGRGDLLIQRLLDFLLKRNAHLLLPSSFVFTRQALPKMASLPSWFRTVLPLGVMKSSSALPLQLPHKPESAEEFGGDNRALNTRSFEFLPLQCNFSKSIETAEKQLRLEDIYWNTEERIPTCTCIWNIGRRNYNFFELLLCTKGPSLFEY